MLNKRNTNSIIEVHQETILNIVVTYLPTIQKIQESAPYVTEVLLNLKFYFAIFGKRLEFFNLNIQSLAILRIIF